MSGWGKPKRFDSAKVLGGETLLSSRPFVCYNPLVLGDRGYHPELAPVLWMGGHPKIVQELLGHSTVSMTLDTYSHVRPSLQKEAVGRLNTLLANLENPVAVTPAKTVGNSGRKKNKPASKAG
jgi:hypothetical protein